MKFQLEVEVSSKGNHDKVLNEVIDRAAVAVMRHKSVKHVDIKGRVISD